MAVLDTSFLIDIIHNSPVALELLVKLERTELNLFVAAPSVMELWAGVSKGKKSQRKKASVEEFLASLNVLPLNSESAKRSAEIEAELSTKGLIIDTEDMMIAGIAVANGEIIITKDAHYTRISNLKVLKY